MGVTKDKTGEHFITNEGCEIIIVQYNKSVDLWVEFQDKYKARIHTSYNACKDGEVKNPYFPSVCGIGCLGLMLDGSKPITRKNKKPTKEYYLWKSMLRRCYGNDENYKTYKDCIVCERWLVFANFLEDLPKIKGYNLWKNNEGYALDKDTYSNDCKIYSLNTCCFITIEDNSKERIDRYKDYDNERLKKYNDNKAIKIYGINIKTGERTRDFDSIKEASRIMNINDGSIGKCINGKQKTSCGYKWYKVDDEN